MFLRGWTEERTSVHWARGDVVYADAPGLEFLASASVGVLVWLVWGRGTDVPGEVLDWSLASGVGAVEAGECAEQCGDDGDDCPAVGNVGGGFLEDEECGFGVDPVGVSY